jgi:hypothetical protein
MGNAMTGGDAKFNVRVEPYSILALRHGDTDTSIEDCGQLSLAKLPITKVFRFQARM